eukprot:1585314-Prymnesium_polylepis.1
MTCTRPGLHCRRTGRWEIRTRLPSRPPTGRSHPAPTHTRCCRPDTGRRRQTGRPRRRTPRTSWSLPASGGGAAHGQPRQPGRPRRKRSHPAAWWSCSTMRCVHGVLGGDNQVTGRRALSLVLSFRPDH